MPGPTLMRRTIQRFSAILRQRCPRCFRGAVFRGPITMNEFCPHCGLHFEREPGYFIGAMDVACYLTVPVLFLLVLAIRLLTNWSDTACLSLGTALYLPLIPAMFRCSRVVWMHIDRTIDPDRS